MRAQRRHRAQAHFIVSQHRDRGKGVGMSTEASEIHSTLGFDYGAYTDENLRRVEGSWAEFQNR